MLALNYGTLSFLSGNPARDDVELVMNALAGDMVFEHRSTADITIEQADGQVINATALNEVAYTRGRSGRVVEYRYGINGITIAQLKADGLVVATPTGSTGYALSAGGPIVSPAYTGLVVVPVAPHALNTRAIVLAPSDVLEVIMDTTRSRDASVFVDGVMIDVDRGAPRRARLALGTRWRRLLPQCLARLLRWPTSGHARAAIGRGACSTSSMYPISPSSRTRP